MRSFVKRLVALLPWNLRKLVLFFAEHGLISRPGFAGVYSSFADFPTTIKAAETDQADAAARGIARGPVRDGATNLPRLPRAHTLLPLVAVLLAKQKPNEPLNIL